MTGAARRMTALTVLALTGGAGCGGDQETASTARTTQDRPLSQVELVDKVRPTVVRIFGRSGGGSGVVIDAQQGLVLTNAHVAVGLAGMKAVIGDDPATETSARLVGAAPCEDLAVVRLVNRPTGLRPIALGSSRGVRAGQQVTVLGYPGSFEEDDRTGGAGQATQVNATTGTVSAANIAAAPDPALPRFASTIQHQAPVNPGNSGGPLVDDRGRLIGINTLRNPETQGQFYAISIDRARTVLPELVAGRSQAAVGWDLVPLDQVDLGFELANDPDFSDQGPEFGEKVASALENNEIDGLYVMQSQQGSPAYRAQVYYGDLVTELDNEPVTKVQDVCDILVAKNPGDRVRVEGLVINSATREQLLDAYTVTMKVR